MHANRARCEGGTAFGVNAEGDLVALRPFDADWARFVATVCKRAAGANAGVELVAWRPPASLPSGRGCASDALAPEVIATLCERAAGANAGVELAA